MTCADLLAKKATADCKGRGTAADLDESEGVLSRINWHEQDILIYPSRVNSLATELRQLQQEFDRRRSQVVLTVKTTLIEANWRTLLEARVFSYLNSLTTRILWPASQSPTVRGSFSGGSYNVSLRIYRIPRMFQARLTEAPRIACHGALRPIYGIYQL
jgi:hypothetical protein